MIKQLLSLILKRQDVTEMYPNEVSKPLLFKRSKGFISVNTYKCSLCSICAKECPSGAISIDYNNLALKVDYAK